MWERLTRWRTQAQPAVASTICPRCDSEGVESLGAVASALSWFQCRACRHVWSTRTSAVRPPRPLHDDACPRCAGMRSEPAGPLTASPLVHRRCSDCGHTTAVHASEVTRRAYW
jgi:hypothetical protein